MLESKYIPLKCEHYLYPVPVVTYYMVNAVKHKTNLKQLF